MHFHVDNHKEGKLNLNFYYEKRVGVDERQKISNNSQFCMQWKVDLSLSLKKVTKI